MQTSRAYFSSCESHLNTNLVQYSNHLKTGQVWLSNGSFQLKPESGKQTPILFTGQVIKCSLQNGCHSITMIWTGYQIARPFNNWTQMSGYRIFKVYEQQKPFWMANVWSWDQHLITELFFQRKILVKKKWCCNRPAFDFLNILMRRPLCLWACKKCGARIPKSVKFCKNNWSACCLSKCPIQLAKEDGWNLSVKRRKYFKNEIRQALIFCFKSAEK